MLEDAREERVRLPVVERDVRGRADEDEHVRLVEPELVEGAAVGLEVREVVLLLQARVLPQLRRAHTVALEPLGWDRLGDEHARGRAAAELVLHGGKLVVEGVAAGDPERPGRQREVVRAVCERDVEAAPLRPRAELP